VKKLSVNSSDCSCLKLIRIAKKCGFIIIFANKHCKINSKENDFITTVPRHNRLKRETVKGIVSRFNLFLDKKIIIK